MNKGKGASIRDLILLHPPEINFAFGSVSFYLCKGRNRFVTKAPQATYDWDTQSSCYNICILAEFR